MTHARPVEKNDIAGSYLTFHLISAKYAIPVDHIEYITTLDAVEPHHIPGSNQFNRRVFSFQDLQVPLFSFCHIVDKKSQQDECKSLIVLLLQRKQDHIDWMDALHASIKDGTDFRKNTDPHQCAFGQWYDQYKTDDEDLNSILVQFNKPHQRIHSLAHQLLPSAENTIDKHEAIRIFESERHSTLKDLLRLFDMAVDHINDLIKPVVVILKSEQKVFAIELDSIDQIIEFKNEHWLEDSSHELNHSCYDGFLQINNNELFIKLNPENLFYL